MSIDITALSDTELDILESGDQAGWARIAAQKHNVPEYLVDPVIKQESGGKQSAVSSKGAKGVMQLMPGTAKSLGVNPNDWAENIWGGMQYLGEQLKEFKSPELALAAYNAGPGRVKGGKVPDIKETKNYVKNITGNIDVTKLSDDELDMLASGEFNSAQSSGITSCTGDSCGDALASYLNAGPLKGTGQTLPRGGIGPGELASVGKNLGAPVYSKEDLSPENLTPGTVIHMTRQSGDKNYEYGKTHIGIVDNDEQGNTVFRSFTAGKGWRSQPIDQNFINELPAQITATNVTGAGLERRMSAVAAGTADIDLTKLSDADLDRLVAGEPIGSAVPVPASKEGVKFRAGVGVKKGLIDLAMKAAGAIPPIPGMSVEATEEGLRSFWDSTYENRATEVKGLLSKELFPAGMPTPAPGWIGELTEAAFEMWPAFMLIGAAGGIGAAAGGAMMPANIAGATLPQLLAASAVGGAIPFAAYGMLENNPLLGAVKSAGFGAVLGGGKLASSLIANSFARWAARVAGGAGLGAGGAALEGADSHEIAKQAILFSIMEAFGPPGVNKNVKLWLKSKGVTEPAASGMVNTFNDLVTKLQKERAVIETGETAKVIADAEKAGKQLSMEDVTRLVGMEREAEITGFGGTVPPGMEGIPQRDYPSTIVPTTVEITKGKGKKARTTSQLAFEEVHPEDQKLTGLGPEMTDLYLQKVRQENEATLRQAGSQWSREKRRFLDEPLEIDKAPVIFDFGESTAPEARKAIVESMFPEGKRALAMNAVSKMPPEMTAGEVVGKLKELFPTEAADAMVVGGRIRFSAGVAEKEIAPTWYSRARDFISTKLPGVGTGPGLANTIEGWVSKGVMPGKEEVKWTGVVPWLQERKGKVTRKEVEEFLKENGVRLRVVEKGTLVGMTEAERDRMIDLDGLLHTRTPEQNAELDQLLAKSKEPSFKSYVKPPPGSTNYREFYGMWPAAEQRTLPPGYRVEQTPDGLWKVKDAEGYGIGFADTTREGAINTVMNSDVLRDTSVKGENDVFRVPSGHQTGDPSADLNRVFHVFTWDQVIGGKKYLVIGELQSDWAGKGRKEGYRQEKLPEGWQVREATGTSPDVKFWQVVDSQGELKASGTTKEAALKMVLGGTPQFPFSKNWMEVAMKKMLRQASEEGYDGLAWVSGDVVKERYDLSKHIDTLAYKKEGSDYILEGDKDGVSILDHRISADKLAETVGKEIADKIIAGKGEILKSGHRVLSNIDLKVGGEWANKQYDSVNPATGEKVFGMPVFMDKYGKQWGARVGEESGSTIKEIDPGVFQVFGSRDTTTSGMFVDRLSAEKFQSANPEKVHTLDITPKMKETVLQQGQYMFSNSKGKPVPQVVNEQTLRAAFGEESGARISKMEDSGDWLVQLPNGMSIRVYPNADIVIDPKAWFMAYKRPYAGEELYGTWRTINYGGAIQLAKEGPRMTLHHEVFHAAIDLALTPAEREAIIQKYGTEEKAARAYEDWNPLERPDTLFGKIMHFFKSMLRGMFPGAEEAFQKIRSGEVWAEKPAMRMVSEQPMKYSALTEEWNKLKEGPKLGRPSEGTKQAHNTLLKATQRAWAPETGSPEGMLTVQEWTKHITTARAEVVKAAKVMNDYRVQFMDMAYEDRWALSAKMERGEEVPPEWRPYAQARQQVFDAVHQQIGRIKDGHVGYITNYAPHLYADPVKAAQFFDSVGKRPLEGRKGFLKQRHLPTMDEARAHGLEPLFDNPVQQDLAGLMEQWRFVAGNDFIDGLVKQKLFIPIKTLRPGYSEPAAEVPEGWIKTDSRVFRAGYAPRDAINVIHNHLMSEAGGLWYNKYKNMTAMWNAWHVTLSAFHGMTTLVHGLSIGAYQPIPDLLGAIAAGDHASAMQALKRVGPMGVVNMFKLAKQGKDEFYNPGKHGDKMAALVKLATEGGALPEHTMLMQGMAADSFKEMFQQLKGGDIGPAFRSMTHLLGKPIMGYLVPTVKYGSTLLRIERELDTLQRRYNQKYGSEWSPEVQGDYNKDMAAIAYNERQFSDNIFGEIHPDNMHWNRNIAKGLKGLIAYPGWNIGTLRWLTGMARGVGKVVTGKEVDYQAKRSLEFGAGLIITTAIVNTILHTVLNNGEAPDDWKDVLIGARTGKYLNNGQPERITIASYMKDVAAMSTHPGKAMLAKMQAPFSIMQELYQNSDYFGTEIVPSKGTVIDKAASLGKYIAGKAAPFGFSNIATGKSDLAKYGGLVGFRTVPRVLTNSPAQNMIDDILRQQSPKSRSTEDADRSRLVSELKELGWNNERPEMAKRIAAARREGILTAQQAQNIREDIQKDKRVVQFKKLRSIEDAIDVYEAGTPEERKLWRPILSGKWSMTAAENMRRYRQDYLRVIKLPVADTRPYRVPPRPQTTMPAE